MGIFPTLLLTTYITMQSWEWAHFQTDVVRSVPRKLHARALLISVCERGVKTRFRFALSLCAFHFALFQQFFIFKREYLENGSRYGQSYN